MFAAVKADKGPDNSQTIQVVSNVQPNEYEFQIYLRKHFFFETLDEDDLQWNTISKTEIWYVSATTDHNLFKFEMNTEHKVFTNLDEYNLKARHFSYASEIPILE